MVRSGSQPASSRMPVELLGIEEIERPGLLELDQGLGVVEEGPDRIEERALGPLGRNASGGVASILSTSRVKRPEASVSGRMLDRTRRPSGAMIRRELESVSTGSKM